MSIFDAPVFGTPAKPGLFFPVALWEPDLATGYGASTFPAVLGDLDASQLFPTRIPDPERLIYQFILDATGWRIALPEATDTGVTLPTGFSQPPQIEQQATIDIPVIRGWPAYPGAVPAIGVALSTESEDLGEDAIAAGFAGDVALCDQFGNVLASTAYFAEPLYSTTVVELIHENRDERDRLHNELRRVLFPLRRQLPGIEPLIRRVQVDAEKHEIDEAELPLTIYASIFTVHTWGEMLVPTDVIVNGDIQAIQISVQPH